MVRCPAGAWEQRRRMEPEAAPQSEIGTCYVFIIITLTQENPEKPIDTFQHIVKNLTRTYKETGTPDRCPGAIHDVSDNSSLRARFSFCVR